MGGNVVRSVVFSLLLLIVCFIIGSQVAGAREDQMLAFGMIGLVVVLFGSILVGNKIWWLFYLVPWLLWFRVPDQGDMIRGGISWQMLLAPFFLLSWLLLFMLRKVRCGWYRLPVADLIVLVIMLYTIGTYVAHPVSVNILEGLGIEFDMEGGKDYLIAALAIVYYITFNLIPVPKADFDKLFKRMFFCLLGAQVFGLLINLRWLMFVLHASGDKRFEIATMMAFALAAFAVCQYRLFSLKSIRLMVVSLFFLFVCGSREYIARFGLLVGILSLLRREIMALLIGLAMGVGGIYMLASQGMTQKLPGSAQRIAQLLPGVEVSQNIAGGTKGSTDDRVAVWKRALDPRTGLIRDRIWGDGFGRSKKAKERMQIAAIRKPMGVGIRETLTLAGDWHNGLIQTMHRMGLVMVGLGAVYFLYAFYLTCRIFLITSGTSMCGYLMVPIAYMIHEPFFYWWFDGTGRLFASIVTLCYIKLIVCHLIDEGKWVPLFSRRRYVPMMVREMGSGAGA